MIGIKCIDEIYLKCEVFSYNSIDDIDRFKEKAELIKQILEKHGHTMIAEAGDGKEAIQRYTEYHPDVTILDITMPEMSGLEALAHIKEKDPQAKVVICSALGQQEQLAKAIQLGAKDFIVKPFEPDRMIAALNKVLEG